MINGIGEDDHQHTNTPLLDAIENGHNDIARWLIEEGADIFRVCSYGQTALWSACAEGNEAIAQILIDRGADVNIRASQYSGFPEQTALQAAVWYGHPRIIRLLKENGAH
jgi:ankyrin repeat protein